MVDREVFEGRLARLEDLLTLLRRLATTERTVFLADVGLKAQAERWLHLAAECALDLAQHLIADRGYRTPGTYREAFAILLEQGVLGDVLADQMARWAGLRNVLVHLYLAVDHEVLFEILQHDLGQLEEYARQMARAVT